MKQGTRVRAIQETQKVTERYLQMLESQLLTHVTEPSERAFIEREILRIKASIRRITKDNIAVVPTKTEEEIQDIPTTPEEKVKAIFEEFKSNGDISKENFRKITKTFHLAAALDKKTTFEILKAATLHMPTTPFLLIKTIKKDLGHNALYLLCFTAIVKIIELKEEGTYYSQQLRDILNTPQGLQILAVVEGIFQAALGEDKKYLNYNAKNGTISPTTALAIPTDIYEQKYVTLTAEEHQEDLRNRLLITTKYLKEQIDTHGESDVFYQLSNLLEQIETENSIDELTHLTIKIHYEFPPGLSEYFRGLIRYIATKIQITLNNQELSSSDSIESDIIEDKIQAHINHQIQVKCLDIILLLFPETFLTNTTPEFLLLCIKNIELILNHEDYLNHTIAQIHEDTASPQPLQMRAFIHKLRNNREQLESQIGPLEAYIEAKNKTNP